MCRLATLVALLLVCAPLSAQQALFRNAAIGYGGGLVVDMKTADVNGDGKPDIVLLQSQPSGDGNAYAIVSLIGNADGTFKAPVKTPLSTTQGRTITLGDLDGDGKLDLVLTSDFTGLVIYRGNGAGSFALVSSQVANVIADACALTDLNADGKLDLVAYVSVNSQTFLATFLGNGDATFGAMTIQPGPPILAMSQTAIADFNGDGLTDVIESSPFGQLLATGNGAGGFNPPTPITSFEGSTAVAGDFNGDGNLDFIVLAGTQASVRLGNGHGNFSAGGTYTVGELSRGVAVDLDADGKLDFVTASNDLLSVMHGNGDGTFSVHSYSGGSSFLLPLVADFDGDHHLDVLTTSASVLLLFHGNGDGTLTAYRKSLVGSNPSNINRASSPRGLAVADFNGDGRPDVVTANDGIIVLLNSGDGGFGAPIPLAIPPEVGEVISFATGDVNGDGRPDIVVGGLSQLSLGATGRVWTYLGNGDGTFAAATPMATLVAPFSLFLADANGDGKLDLLLGDGLGGELLLGDDSGTFGSPVLLPAAPALVADLNGDGRIDFVSQGHDSRYTIYLNDGSGMFRATETVNNVLGVLAAGDFNGDGKTDLVEQGFNQTIRMRLGNGDGTFRDLPPLRVATPDAAVVADFDGDGKLDLAFSNRVLLGDGAGSFRALVPCIPTRPWTTVASGDVDGNGSPDLLLLDTQNGAINALLTRTASEGTTPLSLALTSSLSLLHFQEPVDLTTTATTTSSFLPSGGVTITADGALVGFADWTQDGSAILNWANQGVGAHQVVSTFIGDDIFPAASATITPFALKLDSVLEFNIFLEPSQQKQPTNIFATISTRELDAGPTPPTGTITIGDGDTVLLSAPYNSDGRPAVTFAFPTVGIHNLTLQYSGDGNYTAATASLSHTVIKSGVFVGMTATPPSPLTVGQSLTLSVAVSAFVDPTGGTVTFLDNGIAIGNAPVSGIFATITIQPAWGSHSYSARYSGNGQLDPTSMTFTLDYTVNLGPFGTPVEVRATAVSATNVNVDWSPLTGVTTYDLFRRGPGGSLTVFSGFTVPHMNDTTVAPSTTYLYQVAAHNGSGATSAPGASDWATTVPFTDDPLIPGATTVKALHISELRTAINAMRATAGLPAATWSSDPLNAFIRATDLTELRSALVAARAALGAPVTFTDPSLVPGATIVRGIHFQEIRDAVR